MLFPIAVPPVAPGVPAAATSGLIQLETAEILQSTDEAFERAVREVLPRMRFGPESVRRLVALPFAFEIR